MAAELVGQRHQQRAADARLDVFFGGVLGPAGKLRRQRGLEGLELGHDGDLVVAHAQALRHLARVDPADVGRVGRRHHHRAHPVGAQRIHRNRQHQRRIDAARQAQDGARKAVLAHVVAHAQHQRVPQVGSGLRSGATFATILIAACAVSTWAAPRTGFPKTGARPASVPSAFQRKRMALEHHLVLPAHQVRVDQRQAAGAHALAHRLLALAALAHMEGRGVDHRQQLGPGAGPARAGSSNQASSQISRPTRMRSPSPTSNTHCPCPA
jgi:hypothetical protein